MAYREDRTGIGRIELAKEDMAQKRQRLKGRPLQMSAVGIEECDIADARRLERRREVANQRITFADLNSHAAPSFADSAQRIRTCLVKIEEVMPVDSVRHIQHSYWRTKDEPLLRLIVVRFVKKRGSSNRGARAAHLGDAGTSKGVDVDTCELLPAQCCSVEVQVGFQCVEFRCGTRPDSVLAVIRK